MRYADELAAGNPRHASVAHLRTAVDERGRFLAHESRIAFDGGAYAGGKPIPGGAQGGRQPPGLGDIPVHLLDQRLRTPEDDARDG